MSRFRACVFTVNNPTEDDEVTLLNNLGDTNLLNYVIFGHEEGEGGTYHWQGYAQFTKQLSLSAVKKILPRAHIETVRGTQKQAIDYCKKDGLFDEYGNLKTHGGQKKNKSSKKYAAIKERILTNNDSLQKVVLEDCDTPSHVHYAQFMEKYAPLGKVIRNVSVYWYYGPTGCSKSYDALKAVKEDNYWSSSVDLKWFDGYFGQEDVIIDDFRSSHSTFSWLLRLLDKYPLKVPVKGGFVRWCPLRIYITSPYHPKECYSNIEDKTQLLRRIKEIKKFTTRYVPDGEAIDVSDVIVGIDPSVPPEDPILDALIDPNNPDYAFLNGY